MVTKDKRKKQNNTKINVIKAIHWNSKIQSLKKIFVENLQRNGKIELAFNFYSLTKCAVIW